MKNILFLIVTITLISNVIYSQDLITFKDGSVKSVNVKEISETELKYQKIENSSVIYSVLKTSLFSVQFKNGEKEVFNQPAVVVTQIIAPQTKQEAVIEQLKAQKNQPPVSAPIPDIYIPKPAMVTFKDGTVKSVTIKELTDTEVKYQKAGNVNTIYSASKTDLLSIQFINGEKEVFNQPVVVVTQIIAPQIKKETINEQSRVQKNQPLVSVPIPDIYLSKSAMITFKDGTVKAVTIKGLTDTEVKYQKAGNSNTIYSALKTDLLSVQFKNGEVEVFGQSGILPQTKKNSIVEDTQIQKYEPIFQETTTKQATISENTVLTKRQYSDMFQQGKNDAKIYYKGYKGAGTGTFFASLLTGPIFGLIPAIACSSTSPSSDNMTFPSVELMRNPDYVSGYTQQAKAKKSGKVWGNYGIGTAVLLLVLASQVRR